MSSNPVSEGGLQAPTRHALNWREPEFVDEQALYGELERVFDICHGCRRCVNLCNAFPSLFDLIDESKTMEIDGVDKADYMKVVDECYLCDLCYLTKCPYVPPHEWNVDFPHLMLQAKHQKFLKGKTRVRDKILSSTDSVGKLAGIPIVSGAVNAANRNPMFRGVLEKTLGVHHNAKVPTYHSKTLRKRLNVDAPLDVVGDAAGVTTGKVALFATCYCNYNEPDIGEDLVAVFRHNGIGITMAEKEQCCGMPKLELGDLDAVEKLKDANIYALAELVDQGFDIVAAIPSCVLMFKQELPLMFPDDPQVLKVKNAIYDPFEYLMLRHNGGKLRTDFTQSLGEVVWHVACHQRVQKIGPKTRDILNLVPDTKIHTIERCSGHDGTYAVKVEFHDSATKIGRPIVNQIKKIDPDHYTSDCPMAGTHIANGLDDGSEPGHPMTLLRLAYGI